MIDYCNYTVADWENRLLEIEAKGEIGTLAVTCLTCMSVIAPMDYAPSSSMCKCGHSVTSKEIIAAHGLTDCAEAHGDPLPIETWAEVS